MRILTSLIMVLWGALAAAQAVEQEIGESLRNIQRAVRQGYLMDLNQEELMSVKDQLRTVEDIIYGQSATPKYACVHNGGDWYYVTELETNRRLGTQIHGLDKCREILPKAWDKYACVHNGGDWFYVTELATSEKLGTQLHGFDKCKQVVPGPRDRYACVHNGGDWYYVTELATKNRLGNQVHGLDKCKELIP